MYIEDESVQSWFFRQALLSGESKFENVIGTDGKWYGTPCLGSGCTLNLHSIPDLGLLRFLRKSGIANKDATMFDNPVNYVKQMSIVTPSKYSSSNSKGQITIRFCEDCIGESIKENGFGYFKAEWLSSIHCSIHDVNLRELTSRNRQSAAVEISRAFSGRPVSESQISFDLDKDSHLYRESKSDELYHIMPCLLDAFYMWASKKSDNAELKYEYLDFYHQNGMRKEVSDEYLHHKFMYFREHFPMQLKGFLERASELKEYKFGFRQRFSFSETLVKSKNQNCSKCSYWRTTDFCPIKPIKVTMLNDDFYYSRTDNPCDYYLKYRVHRYRS
ncbi:hypothetical protein ACSEYT_00450 [Vibrio cidicii]|uniref:hypothetical protein n=1 Tax=Vibrio cidicii TaxID=1763883 RepID=UPI001C9BC896|nr:hypothetical protein [Vibrio fluvialis]